MVYAIQLAAIWMEVRAEINFKSNINSIQRTGLNNVSESSLILYWDILLGDTRIRHQGLCRKNGIRMPKCSDAYPVCKI